MSPELAVIVYGVEVGVVTKESIRMFPEARVKDVPVRSALVTETPAAGGDGGRGAEGEESIPIRISPRL
jgi:hypothetical protein